MTSSIISPYKCSSELYFGLLIYTNHYKNYWTFPDLSEYLAKQYLDKSQGRNSRVKYYLSYTTLSFNIYIITYKRHVDDVKFYLFFPFTDKKKDSRLSIRCGM